MSINKIQEIKDKVGPAAQEIIASQLHLEKIGGKYRCPDKMAHRHGDRTPSMAWDNNLLQFKCFGCGKLIDIYSLYREHLNYTHAEIVREILGNDQIKDSSMVKNRAKLEDGEKKLLPLDDHQLEYLKKRKLEESTIHKFRLQSYNGMIAIPYYQNGVLIGCKTRRPEKHTEGPKYLSIPGSKPGLFNIDNVEPDKPLIICEGEFDCMVISQAGFENVVSVGAGANSLTDLIEQYRNFLERFDSLIIFSDRDEAGGKMDEAFFKAFPGKAALIDKAIMNGKDANEAYLRGGDEAIGKIVESAEERIEGFFDPAADNTSLTELFSRGRFIPTGLPSIDYGLNDLAPGCVTLIAGRANGGKSTLVNQIVANAIQKDNKVLLISGEDDKRILLNKIYKAVIGRDKQLYDLVKINKRFYTIPKPEVKDILKEWHKDKLHFFMKGESGLKTTDQLFQLVGRKVRMEHYNLLVIDNLMSVLSVATAAEKYELQADFIQRCCDLVKLYHCHIIVVLHPNKTFRKGDQMDFEQISGSSDISNKADNIITVIREYDEEKKSRGVNGYVEVLKNRYFHDLPKVSLHYDEATGLLFEFDEDEGLSVEYRFDLNKLEEDKNKEPGWFQETLPVNVPWESDSCFDGVDSAPSINQECGGDANE